MLLYGKRTLDWSVGENGVVIGWVEKIISFLGGCITLIKSTFSSLPSFYSSLFPIPVNIARCIEKLQRDFVWIGLGDEFKYHLVKLKTICVPVQIAGLGVRDLVLFNKSLLGK